MCRITYEADYLKSINNIQLKPSANLQAILDELTLYKKRTKRGCRAGRYKQRQIRVVNSHRAYSYQPSQPTTERGVDFDNLMKIQPTHCHLPSNNNDGPIAVTHQHPDQQQQGVSGTAGQLPTIFMTNAQSLGNKFEDIEVVFEQNNVEVGVVSESWFK
jgi:hypothetical protein